MKGKLLRYKQNLVLRFALAGILAISMLTLGAIFGALQKAIAAAVLIIVFEHMTLNLLFDREFYPLDMFADAWFPDRSSFGYKALYIGFYFGFWVLTCYALATSD